MKIKCGGVTPAPNGWINIDAYKRKYTDKVVDLNKFPYPFEDSSIEEIECKCVLEHLLYPLDALIEFHRILRKDGKLHLVVAFYNHPKIKRDITYFHNFSYDAIERSLEYYGHQDKYKIAYKKIHYSRVALIRWKWLGHIIPNYITFIEYILKKQ